MRRKTLPLQKLVVCALLLSLLLLMSFTPIGFLAIGPVSITMAHLPVLVGLLCEGLGVGLFLGGAFGIISMVRALTPTTLLAPFFLNPLVSVMPRLLLPVLAWLTYHGLWKLLSRWPRQRALISYAGSALVGSATNTIVVLSMLQLIFREQIAKEMLIDPGLVSGVLIGIVVSNGIPELILSVLVVPPLVLAVHRAMKRDIKE